MDKLRDPGFWLGLGLVLLMMAFVGAYVLGWIATVIDEAFFGGEWADQPGDWTYGSAIFLGLSVAFGYCCGYVYARREP